MKIQFKRTRLRVNLIIGIVWIVLGTSMTLVNDNIHWTNYGYFILSILYIGFFLHDYLNQYMTIENGTIRKNGLYGHGKQINLNDIICVQRINGDYLLKTNQQEFKINTDLMDKDSLIDLLKILSQLNLPPEKTPF
ncbi:hypothetical protein [uncultured Draconibacterium sp.]|uniref:hypothetical protein n=1 Tax=uncultured Draconibacterium sp. TaxID=1573823 RepID=UPI0029C8BEA0|nr:hypothetical protein [uncultured Draconibacterium sp.]